MNAFQGISDPKALLLKWRTMSPKAVAQRSRAACTEPTFFVFPLESFRCLTGAHITCVINSDDLCQAASLEKWTSGSHTLHSFFSAFQQKLETSTVRVHLSLSLSVRLYTKQLTMHVGTVTTCSLSPLINTLRDRKKSSQDGRLLKCELMGHQLLF